ncbi:uncharacterized protein LOC134827291 [Culicoides brevitarsis]|uniref:uncharacterized protein LOC134827291 n=1 Tax=Culicoides brevitarsis TaxID=469753 RepID=UPI00307B4E47
MNSKILIFGVFCLFGQIIADEDKFDYRVLLEKVFNTTERNLDIFQNATMDNFYRQQSQMLQRRFEKLAYDVGYAKNPYATAHVYHFRKNYSSVTYLVDKMLEDSRQSILNSFNFQRHHLAAKKPEVDETSRDVYFMLLNKNCNESVSETFFTDFFYGISNKIIEVTSEAHKAYMSQVKHEYAEFKLFDAFTSQLNLCATGNVKPMSHTTSCMVQKDDLYLSSAINVVSEKMKSVEDVVANFNFKTTDYIVNYIDEALNMAYKNASLIRCPNDSN